MRQNPNEQQSWSVPRTRRSVGEGTSVPSLQDTDRRRLLRGWRLSSRRGRGGVKHPQRSLGTPDRELSLQRTSALLWIHHLVTGANRHAWWPPGRRLGAESFEKETSKYLSRTFKRESKQRSIPAGLRPAQGFPTLGEPTAFGFHPCRGCVQGDTGNCAVVRLSPRNWASYC